MCDPYQVIDGYIREIERLRDILDRSPCGLYIQHSDSVIELIGHGSRIMGLEIERLRGALQKIADGEIVASEAADFADAAIEGLRLVPGSSPRNNGGCNYGRIVS